MVYLNNAATSFPKPRLVRDAVADWFSRPPVSGSRTGFDLAEADVVADTRSAIAAFFNAGDPHSIIFTAGATASINTVIRGLSLTGRHVVTTAAEHNSVLRPLVTLEQAGVITLSTVACDGAGQVDAPALTAALRADTALVAVSHCSNVTGATLNIPAISAAAHAAGALLLVDASQSAGALPIDLAVWDADFVACAGHKSLFGLPGIGLLYLRPGLDVEPLTTGGTGTRSDLLAQPPERPLRYEAGTVNLPGVISLQAGVRFIAETGQAAIHQRVVELVQRATARLSANPRLRWPGGTAAATRIMCFWIDGVTPQDAGYVLESAYGICVRSGLHCAPLIHRAMGRYPEGTIRASPSYFTTHEDMDVFVEAIDRIAESAG